MYADTLLPFKIYYSITVGIISRTTYLIISYYLWSKYPLKSLTSNEKCINLVVDVFVRFIQSKIWKFIPKCLHLDYID